VKLDLVSAGGSCATLLPERGGLLSSLSLLRANGTKSDILWVSADFDPKESGWPSGGMPFMFPFAGRVFCGLEPFKYELGGKIWPMPLHGFAYAHKWRVDSASDQTAVLSLTTSEASRQLFPFDFEVKLKYTLEDSSLLVEATVYCHEAHCETAPRMPVALGWHPYFRLPPPSSAGRDAIRLETPAATQLNVTAVGAAGKPSPFPDHLAGDCQDLENPHLANLILGDLKSSQAKLRFLVDGYAVDLTWHQAFHYLVLWTKRGEDFHCVEPWMGLPDALSNGAGLKWLAPSESLSNWFRISVR